MRPTASSAGVQLRMRTTRRRDTPAELGVRSLVHRAGLRFRVDAKPLPSMRTRADMVFRSTRVAVFIDGCFWHGCPRHATWPKANAAWWRAKLLANRRRDREADRRLRQARWLVIRIWEHEAAARAAQRVINAVRRRAP